MLAFANAIWYHSRRFLFGDIAQLVERLNGIEKVRGSTPLISTIKSHRTLCVGIFFLFYDHSFHLQTSPNNGHSA